MKRRELPSAARRVLWRKEGGEGEGEGEGFDKQESRVSICPCDRLALSSDEAPQRVLMTLSSEHSLSIERLFIACRLYRLSSKWIGVQPLETERHSNRLIP